ncbi:MAG TPA: hypothetical protein VE933_00405 [Chitinophagaceae bacterium]|nr:hypothetical protein [Chitinophagaceae bacterium]
MNQEKEIVLIKKKWKNVRENILALANSTGKGIDSARKNEIIDFTFHIDKVAGQLEEKYCDYVYEMVFDYGDRIIEDGQAVFLKKENLNKIKVIDETGFKRKKGEIVSGTDSRNKMQLIDDCDPNTDFPLSIVTENFIEVFTGHATGFGKYSDYYEFPLNIIEQGNFFGVWGSLDFISENVNKKLQKWHAVAGRRSFVSTMFNVEYISNDYLKFINSLVAGYEFQLNTQDQSEIYKKSSYFNDFFSCFIKKVIRDSSLDWKTKIIIFPHFYYKSAEKDSVIEKLQLLLFKKGWSQSKRLRDSLWDDKTLHKAKITDKNGNENALVIEYGLPIRIVSHINSIIENENSAYLLKQIDDRENELIVKAYEILCDHFKNKTVSGQGYKNYAEYQFPFTFIFSKFKDVKNYGVVQCLSPALNIPLESMAKPSNFLEKIKADQLELLFAKHNVTIECFAQHKLQTVIKNGSYDDFMEMYLKKSTNYLKNKDSIRSGKGHTNIPHLFNSPFLILKHK